MTSLGAQALRQFCDRFGVASPLDIERIRAGRNSEVLLLANPQGRWILKNYYRHDGDSRDRLGTEFDFLTLLQNSGVAGVPRPLGADRDLGCGLYSFLPGIRPNVIDAGHVRQAAGFVREINRHRQSAEAQRLPKAADACLSFEEHMGLVESRVTRLMAVTPTIPLEFAAHEFLAQKLVPFWAKLQSKIANEVHSKTVDPILSPSDFGFHNALENEGQLSFVDFEYAGWDDPAKLICDFICQPEVPVTIAQGMQFRDELAPDLADTESIRRRVEQLLPMHRLKWCCIMLNEFKSEDRQRRSHAGVAQDGLLARQLNKSMQYFDAHLASTH